MGWCLRIVPDASCRLGPLPSPCSFSSPQLFPSPALVVSPQRQLGSLIWSGRGVTGWDPSFPGDDGLGESGVEGGGRGDRARRMAWVGNDEVGNDAGRLLPPCPPAKAAAQAGSPPSRGRIMGLNGGHLTKNAPGLPEAFSFLAGADTGVIPCRRTRRCRAWRAGGGLTALFRLSRSAAGSRTGGTAAARRSSTPASSRHRPRGCRPPACPRPSTRSG